MRDFAPPDCRCAGPTGVRRRALLAGVGSVVLAGPGAVLARAVATDWSGVPQALRPVIGAAGLPAASIGLAVQQVQGSLPPLAALNADQPYQLASTAKVVTSLAALDLLGPHYRWRTYAFALGPVRQGRLLGDLVIVGGGNARLRSAQLREWFERMQREGLREVWGDIVLDRFAFRLQDADHAHTPEPAADRPHHARPDALTLDEGVLQVTVQAGPRGRPQLRLWPPLTGMQVKNEVGASGGCAVWAHAAEHAGAPQLAVRGSWAPHCGQRELTLAPLPHDEYTVRAIDALWRDAGGRLRGRVVDKPAPDRKRLWPEAPGGDPLLPFSVHLSDPLPQVIREINKSSDNLAARNLMLSLVPGFPMRAATLPEAQQRVADWLLTKGVTPGAIALENGSGLSRAERGTPRAMVHLLRGAWGSRLGPAFVDSLPVAGVDGTLAHRMTAGRATGAAFLKTGTLLDTRALAGYVRAASGRTYAVAALVNHPEAQRATPALDALIEWVARFG